MNTLIYLSKMFNPPFFFSILKHLKKNPWQFEFLLHNALFEEKELAKAAPNLDKLYDADIFLHKFPHLREIPAHVASFLYFDVKTRLPDCFILQYERLTAAQGLLWHAPFLSRKLI